MSRSRRRWRRAAAGFTLLEVLLSMLLLAMLMAAIYAALASAVRWVHAGEAQAQRSEQLFASQRFLRRSLSQIRSVAVMDPVDGVAHQLLGYPRQLQYVAPSVGSQAGRGLQLYRLQLASQGSRRWRLELSIAPVPPIGQPPRWRLPPEVLLDGIVSGHFAYRGSDTSSTPGRWLLEWTPARHLPRLVTLQIQLDGARSWPSLVVPLRIEADPLGGDDTFGEMP
ncbi:prepilin-type N-terminal cleavage/methylation domain-containing protein [Frateuria aurantia]